MKKLAVLLVALFCLSSLAAAITTTPEAKVMRKKRIHVVHKALKPVPPKTKAK